VRNGFFRKDEFRYDPDQDVYICPAGETLSPHHEGKLRRRETVEHPFGSIKQWMNQGAFLMKGLDNVRAEFSLTALVYNLRRALNILGVEALMAAVRA
jgi:Transposase DDE domain